MNNKFDYRTEVISGITTEIHEKDEENRMLKKWGRPLLVIGVIGASFTEFGTTPFVIFSILIALGFLCAVAMEGNEKEKENLKKYRDSQILEDYWENHGC